MKKTYTCINCPAGCQVTAEILDKKVIKVEGNTCEKGESYVIKEVENPSRIVTSTVAVTGGEGPVVSVRTRREVPKDKIFDVMKMVNNISVTAPVEIGDIIIQNVFGTDVIATASMRKYESD